MNLMPQKWLESDSEQLKFGQKTKSSLQMGLDQLHSGSGRVGSD